MTHCSHTWAWGRTAGLEVELGRGHPVGEQGASAQARPGPGELGRRVEAIEGPTTGGHKVLREGGPAVS